MLKYDVGINAGIIWHLLEEKGPMTYSQIGEQTNFNMPEIMLALGWLSREEKVSFTAKGKETLVSLNNGNFYF